MYNIKYTYDNPSGADWPMGSLRRSYPQFLKALQQFAMTKGLS